MRSILSGCIAALVVPLFIAACRGPEQVSEPSEPSPVEPTSVADWHSFSNPDEVRVSHLDLDLDIDFSTRRLNGTATLSLERTAAATDGSLVLDTRGLDVQEVLAQGEALEWQWGRKDDIRGTELVITLPEAADKVTVRYATSPDAAGLQWLTGEQTTSGRPFLFTQSQPIQARSWIPLQDTPQVRFTYAAQIKVPKDLRAVMSADNPQELDSDGVYRVSMPQPIPSYLMALAAGRLDFQSMSARTGVYAEPSVVEAAAKEFADTEQMMEVGEALYGPYRWGRYDLLILPPSFPFGGMENPRLSFITPTVIAGDKSLVALIAHELAHSWSGNLVTNATWNDLWLNEGFTVYFESRIMEQVYGPDREAMEAVLGYQSLMDDFADLPPEDERLLLDLDERDPDDAFSNVPYEKGRLFLVWLENEVGRERLDAFLRGYFEEYAFESVTTDEFRAYLWENLLDDSDLSREAVAQWLTGPGLPDSAVVPESPAFAAIDQTRARWLEGNVAADAIESDAWSVHEWLYFLNNMPEELDRLQLAELDEAYALTESSNSEIAHSWYRIAIRNDYQPAFNPLRNYLRRVGRRKLVLPLYEDLAKTERGRTFARLVFQEARGGYHPLTTSSVAAALER